VEEFEVATGGGFWVAIRAIGTVRLGSRFEATLREQALTYGFEAAPLDVIEDLSGPLRLVRRWRDKGARRERCFSHCTPLRAGLAWRGGNCWREHVPGSRVSGAPRSFTQLGAGALSSLKNDMDTKQ